MNENFLVIVKVKGVDYLVNVTADSLFDAEHILIDMGICGKRCYSVQSALAFDAKSINTSAFITSAISCSTVSFGEISDIIRKRNIEISESDKAEENISAIKEKIKLLQSQLEISENILSSFEVIS